MSTVTAKPDNYSDAQRKELADRAKTGPITSDIATALSKTELFRGKSARSIISKVIHMGLAYEKKGVKAKPEGAKDKEETVMDIQADIRQLLGLKSDMSLNNKAGWLALRKAIETQTLDDSEDDGTVSETVETDETETQPE